jgi:hypothetical protein
MKKIWNLPITHIMPFSEIEEKRSVLLITSSPAWNAVKAVFNQRLFGMDPLVGVIS